MRDRRHMLECRGCHRPRGEGELFSWTGLCEACGRARMNASMETGGVEQPEWWQRWRRGMVASVGGLLPEDLERGDADRAA